MEIINRGAFQRPFDKNTAAAQRVEATIARLTRVQMPPSVRLVLGRLLPFMPALVLLALIRAFAVNVPFKEEWDLVPFVSAMEDGTLTAADLWAPFSRQRIVLAKFIAASLGAATAFDVTAYMYVALGLQVATLVLLWSVLELTLRVWHRRLIAPLALVFALVMFSPAQVDTWLWGLPSLQRHISDFTVAAAIWVLARWKASWLSIAVSFLLISAGTMALPSTAVSWCVVCIALVTQGRAQPGTQTRLAMWAWVLGASVLGFVFTMDFDGAMFRNLLSLATQPWSVFGSLLVYLGWPLTQGTHTWVSAIAGFAGLCGWAIGLAVATRSANARTFLPWLWLSAHGLCGAVATLIVAGGEATANTNTASSLFFWLGLIVTVSVALHSYGMQHPERVRALQTTAVVLFLVWAINHGRLYYQGYTEFARHKTLRTMGLTRLYLSGLDPGDDLTLLHPSPERVQEQLAALQQRQLGPFAPRMSAERARLEKTIDRRVISGEGHLDVVSCEFIAGWAWDRQQPDLPVNVEVYDGGTLLTTVPAYRFRPDLLDAAIGHGHHSFSYTPAANLRDGETHSIQARVAGTEIYLGGSPKELACGDAR